ncbi:hypothetical protein HDA32_001450 [Spinactinospora alkalitolerans]|uniref:Uncharacterized protein n=1 Tax=Spinactinospora alkalitolerans TaxID=687207 RepID=A0A852TWU1_9ACTN|nr:hypothetical protein [Spinactinospora alkalitolerans]NYE46330.1 hypothetical protein [Spinactinospora alkalitolerans]
MIFDQLISTLGAAGGISAIVAYLTSRIQRSATVESAQIAASAQLNSALHQLQSQSDLERQKVTQTEKQASFQALSVWLHDLEVMIDDIWAGLCGEDLSERENARRLIEEIPWEGRRLPREIVQRKYLWSSETRNLVGEIIGHLGTLYNTSKGALVCLDDERTISPFYGKDERRVRLGECKSEVWQARSDFLSLREMVYSNLHDETFVPSSLNSNRLPN